ncbi:6,7-dimethyl-8-ribityllumazine synthase [bacterium]|nr:6,7-dimethyl-8-ribityllumazine synthase [bacterium]
MRAENVNLNQKKILIVVARFNDMITRSLLVGATDCLRDSGVHDADVQVVWVPGSFEIPVVAAKAARSGKYAAVICLGAVIRGETPHFDFVAGQAASGCMSVALETGLPVIFGVLTTDTIEQALARSGIKGGNKGRDAAQAALEMIKTLDAVAGAQAGVSK